MQLAQLQRFPAPEVIEQGLAVDVLHRDQLLAIGRDQVEDPADVGREHLAGEADLLAQPLLQLRIVLSGGMQSLERNLHTQLEVVG